MIDQTTHVTTPYHQPSHVKSLKDYLLTFTSRLFSQGYRPAIILSKDILIRNFSHWVDSQHLEIWELDELSIDSFSITIQELDMSDGAI